MHRLPAKTVSVQVSNLQLEGGVQGAGVWTGEKSQVFADLELSAFKESKLLVS